MKVRITILATGEQREFDFEDLPAETQNRLLEKAKEREIETQAEKT